MSSEVDLPIRSGAVHEQAATLAGPPPALGGGTTSMRRCEANRRNACASTGPRTGAGKARSAQNARHHGLSVPARYDPSRSAEIAELARRIAGAGADPECFELACRIAAAQIDIVRARGARLALYAQALCERDGIARLAAVERYERRAWSRRKHAIRELDDARRAAGGRDANLDLAERSHRATAEPPACPAKAPQATSAPPAQQESTASSPGTLAERSQPEKARLQNCHRPKRNPGACSVVVAPHCAALHAGYGSARSAARPP
jgi:hypothetical protein